MALCLHVAPVDCSATRRRTRATTRLQAPTKGGQLASIVSMSPKPSTGEDGAERIRKMVREYLDTMEEARDRSALARDYYDGKQWTREEIATLKQRGQSPIVYNRIKRRY